MTFAKAKARKNIAVKGSLKSQDYMNNIVRQPPSAAQMLRKHLRALKNCTKTQATLSISSYGTTALAYRQRTFTMNCITYSILLSVKHCLPTIQTEVL